MPPVAAALRLRRRSRPRCRPEVVLAYAKKYTKIAKVTDLAKRKAKLKAEVEALQARASQPS